MTGRARSTLAVMVVALGAILWYLHDPPWLIRVDSGLRAWARTSDGTAYRWTDGHASFFVRADASRVIIPLRTTFDAPSDRSVAVTIAIDDRPADRLVLTDDTWHHVSLALTRGGRRVRRIDIRTNRTRPGNRGVMVGEMRGSWVHEVHKVHGVHGVRVQGAGFDVQALEPHEPMNP